MRLPAGPRQPATGQLGFVPGMLPFLCFEAGGLTLTQSSARASRPIPQMDVWSRMIVDPKIRRKWLKISREFIAF